MVWTWGLPCGLDPRWLCGEDGGLDTWWPQGEDVRTEQGMGLVPLDHCGRWRTRALWIECVYGSCQAPKQAGGEFPALQSWTWEYGIKFSSCCLQSGLIDDPCGKEHRMPLSYCDCNFLLDAEKKETKWIPSPTTPIPERKQEAAGAIRGRADGTWRQSRHADVGSITELKTLFFSPLGNLKEIN